jgi:hypothetical protein
LAGGKIVVPNHYVAVGQKPFGQGTPDEPGATGYKTSQFAYLYGDEDQMTGKNRPQVVLCIILRALNQIANGESITAAAIAARLPVQDFKPARC